MRHPETASPVHDASQRLVAKWGARKGQAPPERQTAHAREQDRLLDGEERGRQIAKDARHWIAVYREMIVFKEDLLGRVRASIAALPKVARKDVDHDIGLIEQQLQRYQRRQEFWYARHWQLEGLMIDEEDRVVGFRDRTVTLTKRELQLLTHLASRSPSYVSARRLLVDAWHDGQLPEESLRTYIVRLRTKIGSLGAGISIMNRPRRGYALVFPDRE